MSLQPVDGVLGTVISVAKTDMRAANELVRYALYESLTEQIDSARPRLDQDSAKWMGDRVSKARLALDRSVAKSLEGGPDPAALEVAEGLDVLEEFIKLDLIGTALSFFNRSHPRDDKGRFVRQSVGSRTNPNSALGNRQSGHKQEARQYVDRWKQTNLVTDDSDVMLHFTRVDEDGKPLGGDKATDIRHPAKAANVEARIDELLANEPDLLLNGLSFDRKGIPMKTRQQRAALDAAAMFTGAAGVPTAARMLQSMPYDENKRPKNQDQNAQEWNRPTSPGDRQSYRRLQMTGRALQNVSSPGSPGDTIGGLARLVGDLGPEAEKVLGPGVRRTAYRYRGTERRPDPLLVKQVEEAHVFAGGLSSNPDAAADELTRRASQRGELEPSVGVAAHYAAGRFRGWSQDRLELAVQGDTAAVTLLDAIPNEKLAAISIEAGELPPSQGVLIDADGDIVSQAQGYNGDHYLPFDLKNLADLHGGQYVRTRAAGGPTTEDIYTGLLSGARQIQVISNSGVFTLEFDPDLRSGRRYTDKAQRMIGRYGSLLEAIEGGNLFEQDVDSKERGALRIKAYEQMGWDPEQGAKRFSELLNRARLQGSVNQEDEDEIYARAIAEVDEADVTQRQAGRPGMSTQRRAQEIEDIAHDMRAKENAERVRRMVLDGKGYAAALTALKQEFPFFIRDVRFETVRDFTESRKARTGRKFNEYSRDKGYVQRGQTNPAGPRGEYGGRKVPTGRGRLEPVETGEGADVAAPAAGAAARPAAAAPAAARAAAGQAAPAVRDGKVLVPTVEGTKTLDKIVGPGSLVEDSLRSALSRTTGLMDLVYDADRAFRPLDADETPTNVRKSNAMQFAHFKASIEFEKNPRGLANWLYNEADDAERDKFLEGMHQARKKVPTWRSEDTDEPIGDELLTEMAGSPQAFDEALSELDALINLKAPFAEPVDDPVLADPQIGRPQPFPAIVALGDKVENYDAFKAAALEDHPQLAGAIQMAESNVKDHVANIGRLRHAYLAEAGKSAPDQDKLAETREMLDAMQRGWAYAVARKIAEGVDEGPKEDAAKRHQVRKAHQRKRLVYHSPSESFSKRVLQSFEAR